MGDQEWKSADTWREDGSSSTQKWYLLSDQSIQTNLAPANKPFLTFRYDPADPSPSSKVQGPVDLAPNVESRNDKLVFTTSVLQQDLKIEGKIKVHLKVGSDQKDTDFVIRMTEVYPDGRSILLREGIQRMRFRNGYAKSDVSFMSPGEIYPITITLDDLATTIKAGHQLRIVITSSSYPNFQRNMNNGGVLFPNKEMDALHNPQVAENRIYISEDSPSFMTIPLESQ